MNQTPNLLKLYSYKGGEPQYVPNRIRLSNGITRTNRDTFSIDELTDAGWVEVEDKPETTRYEKARWTENGWIVTPLDDIELENEWRIVRKTRDEMIRNVEWRIFRYQSEERLGLEHTDDIVELDNFMQALRDVTNQEDVFNIVWPELSNHGHLVDHSENP